MDDADILGKGVRWISDEFKGRAGYPQPGQLGVLVTLTVIQEHVAIRFRGDANWHYIVKPEQLGVDFEIVE